MIERVSICPFDLGYKLNWVNKLDTEALSNDIDLVDFESELFSESDWKVFKKNNNCFFLREGDIQKNEGVLSRTRSEIRRIII